ncbi:nuclear transport factor 2 family protein [Negadavirga shengliensis]|uniref:Nuclear transport factor 2 family protein n=1 Tax=Negadavirga shengliensis TaxID=1389218 RepID=A0ABV9SWS8_9BACT
MKNSLLFFVYMLTLKVAAQNTEQELIQHIHLLEQQEINAILEKDIKTLEEIWDPEFTVNNPYNMIVPDRQAVIDRIKDGVINYSVFTRDAEKTLVYDNMVITMGEEEIVPNSDNPAINRSMKRRYTNIWQNKNGRWVIVARHANQICSE